MTGIESPWVTDAEAALDEPRAWNARRLDVTTDGGPAPLVSGVGFRQVGAATVELPRLAAVEKELPTRKESLRLDYRVFRVEVDR